VCCVHVRMCMCESIEFTFDFGVRAGGVQYKKKM
jgi:hypothetical protein